MRLALQFIVTPHFAAYMAESIRAAIIGIDRSQMEASLSVSMTTSQAMRQVILPQATVLFAVFDELFHLNMIKSTSTCLLPNWLKSWPKQMEASSSFRFFEAFLAVALIYWGVVVILPLVFKSGPVKLNKAYVR